MKSRKSIQASEYSNFLKHIPSIDQVLSHEKTIDEVCCSNPEFSNYLTPERLRELIRYIIEMPEDPTNHTKSCKFPLIASEFFTPDLPIVSKLLFQDQSLMNYLFSFLNATPLNFLQAGYFLKAYECCLAHSPEDFLLIIFQENYDKALLKQMRSSSISEIVGSILSRSFDIDKKRSFLEGVVELVSSPDKLVSYNACSILVKVSKEDELMPCLVQAHAEFLIRCLESEMSWVVKNSAQVLKNLIINAQDEVVPLFKTHIKPLAEILKKEDSKIKTQFGLEVEKIGESRFAIFEVFLVLYSSEKLLSELSSIFPVILDLFPRFQWCSYFHNSFVCLIESILSNSAKPYIDILASHNFSQVLIRLAKDPVITCAKFQLSRGSVGHVYKLINILVNSKESISEALKGYESWIDFEVKLNNYNEIEAKNIGGKTSFNFFENMSSDSFDKYEEPDLIPDYPNSKPMTGKELEELTELFDFEEKKNSNPFMSTKVVNNASLEELKSNEFLDNLYWKIQIEVQELEDI